MARLRVVRPEPPSLPAAEREAALRAIAQELGSLLVTIVGDAYVLAASLPSSTLRRDAGQIEAAGQRGAILVRELTALLGPAGEARPETAGSSWEADQGRG